MPRAIPKKRDVARLYQKHPKVESLRPGKRSNYESIESYRLEALHEYGRLKVNGTKPNHIIQVNYFTVMLKDEIQALWRKQSRRLRNNGVVARVGLEVTRDKWKQRPASKVHYHFVAKDDRTAKEMEAIFECVFECEMPRSAFKVHVFPFDEEKGGWEKYIEYFLKLWVDDDSLIMLAKNGLRRYYTVNEYKWWTFPDGRTHRPLWSIDEAVQLYAVEQRLQRQEKFIPVKHRPPKRPRPINDGKMKMMLCNETVETLYDWFATLRGKPTLFGTDLPDWFDFLQSRLQQRRALLEAIYDRLTDSENDNMDIIFALKIYHGDITYDLTRQMLVAVNGGKVFA